MFTFRAMGPAFFFNLKFHTKKLYSSGHSDQCSKAFVYVTESKKAIMRLQVYMAMKI